MDLKTGINMCRILVVGMIIFTHSAIAQTPVFDQLREKFDADQVFKADFAHIYLDSYTEESTESSGHIWIDRIGYKLESEGQIIVVDGEISRVYDSSRNRVIISEYDPEEDDFAPSRMLSGLDETYTAAEKNLENGNTLITLVTDDDFAAFIEVEMEIGPDLKPVKITAYDIADNIIITTFDNGSFISRAPSVFQLSYPEDAEIVDMRY